MFEDLLGQVARVGPLIELIRNASMAIVALVGAWVAVKAIHYWQKKRRRTRYDIGEMLILAANDLRDGLKRTHDSKASPEEYTAAMSLADWPDPGASGYVGSRFLALFQYRWARYIEESLDTYEGSMTRAEVQWGPGIHSLTNPLRGLAYELYDNAMAYGSCLRRPEKCELTEEQLADIRDVALGSSGDEFDTRLVDAYDELYDFLRPLLGRPLSVWGRFRRWLWLRRTYPDLM